MTELQQTLEARYIDSAKLVSLLERLFVGNFKINVRSNDPPVSQQGGSTNCKTTAYRRLLQLADSEIAYYGISYGWRNAAQLMGAGRTTVHPKNLKLHPSPRYFRIKGHFGGACSFFEGY